MGDELKDFWEKCDTGLVQLNISTENENKLMSRFEQYVMPRMGKRVDGKTIIDYGVGGGYFGDMVLQIANAKYIGIDISERSLNNAKKRLEKYHNTEFHLVPDSFDQFEADIFCCFACIQHFVTKEYLDEFLDKVNNSKCEELYLQIRHHDTLKMLGDLKDGSKVYYGCMLPATYLNERLTNYTLMESKIAHKTNGYRYLEYDIKK